MALPSPQEIDQMMAAESGGGPMPDGKTDLGTIGLSTKPEPIQPIQSALPSPSEIDQMMLAEQPQRPSVWDATKFIGSSMAEGVGKTIDTVSTLGSFINPNTYFPVAGTEKATKSPIEDLIHSVIGTPADTGVTGNVADIAKAGVQASLFPVGGPLANAVTGMGGEVAAKMFPDSGIAPILGAVATGAGLSGLNAMGKVAIGAGKAFERSSIGAGVRDYIKNQKTTGFLTDEETGDLATRLSQAVEEIGNKSGWGVLRDPGRLAQKNAAQLKSLGGKIKTGLADADAAQIVPQVNLSSAQSATSKLIASAKAEKADVKQAIAEFMDRFLDPVDGWDGTVAGLNSWKSSIQQMAFSGSASGKLTPQVTRRVQRALADDLKKAVDDAVVKSGAVTKDEWTTLMRDYSNHATLAPVIDPNAARAMAGTWDKAARGLLKTSGGTLTTPVLIGGGIAGTTGGAIAGLTAGGALALLGTPTGQGITGAALKAAGRATKEATKGALLSPLASMATNKKQDKKSENKISSLLGKTVGRKGAGLQGDIDMDNLPKHDVEQIAMAQIEADPFLKTLAEFESSTNPKAVNVPAPGEKASSAKGLFQLLDGTAKALKVKDPFSVSQSLEGITKLIDENRARFGDNPEVLYSAHYLGATVLDKLLKGKPLTAEQQKQVNYLKKTLLPRFRQMYAKNARSTGVETA